MDLDVAIRALVRAAMTDDPCKRVSVGLIVAVLARKFFPYPESCIARLATKAVLDAGGTVDLSIPAAVPARLRRSA